LDQFSPSDSQQWNRQHHTLTLRSNCLSDKFSIVAAAFDRDDPAHRLLLAQILLKCADVGNVLCDFDEAKMMTQCRVDACRRQGRFERAKGLPISPMCNPDDTTPLCVGQVEFILFVAGLLMKLVHRFFSELEENEKVPEENLKGGSPSRRSGRQAKDDRDRCSVCENHMKRCYLCSGMGEGSERISASQCPCSRFVRC
jgi:hypothetical protein